MKLYELELEHCKGLETHHEFKSQKPTGSRIVGSGGVCDGVGENKLGCILMDVREELRCRKIERMIDR